MCPIPLATLSFMTTNTETFQFQAEARQVLDLMIHSLYTQKEIFLRELISNASDALDRLRFEALSRPELIGPDEKLEIWIESDPKARTLTISDNGIGMSREEVVAHIGTIAKSGTRDLLESLRDKPSETLTTLIGQFGVGFYSDFISYPIIYKSHDTKEPDRTLNSMKPIWTRPRSEVKDDEYKEFYKHISHDWNEPMETWSFRAEGRSEYQALLFVPSQAPFDLFYATSKFGLHLYVRRVLIMEHCEDLLPPYLRFLRGVVDSADLPLNVSRQRLQEDRHVTQIRKWLTKKVLESLEEMQKNENEGYIRLWAQFGRVLKEGIMDFENKEKLTGLYLFESSHDPGKLTTLKDYVARMNTDQSAIYFLTGPSRRAVENSPHLITLLPERFQVRRILDGAPRRSG